MVSKVLLIVWGVSTVYQDSDPIWLSVRQSNYWLLVCLITKIWQKLSATYALFDFVSDSEFVCQSSKVLLHNLILQLVTADYLDL